MIGDYLNSIPDGDVRVVLCPDIHESIARIELADRNWFNSTQLIVRQWTVLPAQTVVIDDLIASFASVALSVWPSWYGMDTTFHQSESASLDIAILNHFAVEFLKRTKKEICTPWLRVAVKHCQQQNLPIPKQFSSSVQINQLAVAIQPQRLISVLILTQLDPNPPYLLGFAKAATWLARVTNGGVAVVLPEALANYQELDSILYEAFNDIPTEQSQSKATYVEESKLTVWPIQGKPHPHSPGEQLLAEKLSMDKELAALFHFNQKVHTIHTSTYLVDLLWPEGKVVIEVDGYRHHGNRSGFQSDRHRDYELLISDYIVLRLPHADVINDVEICIEKIRDVVRFRRTQKCL